VNVVSICYRYRQENDLLTYFQMICVLYSYYDFCPLFYEGYSQSTLQCAVNETIYEIKLLNTENMYKFFHHIATGGNEALVMLGNMFLHVSVKEVCSL
jgi:hypothetical protein